MTSSPLSPVLTNFVPSDVVPKAVASATCEMARELLIVDRTAAPPGEGISSTQTSSATHDSSRRVELAEQHQLQQGGHAADYVARRAGDAGEVWRVDSGRQRQRAAGEGMKWLWTMLMLAWRRGGWRGAVTLAWDASPSAAVAGYRLYYGTNYADVSVRDQRRAGADAVGGAAASRAVVLCGDGLRHATGWSRTSAVKCRGRASRCRR